MCAEDEILRLAIRRQNADDVDQPPALVTNLDIENFGAAIDTIGRQHRIKGHDLPRGDCFLYLLPIKTSLCVARSRTRKGQGKSQCNGGSGGWFWGFRVHGVKLAAPS